MELLDTKLFIVKKLYKIIMINGTLVLHGPVAAKFQCGKQS